MGRSERSESRPLLKPRRQVQRHVRQQAKGADGHLAGGLSRASEAFHSSFPTNAPARMP